MPQVVGVSLTMLLAVMNPVAKKDALVSKDTAAEERGSARIAFVHLPPHSFPHPGHRALLKKESHVGFVVDDWRSQAVLQAASLMKAASSPLRTFLSWRSGMRPPST